MPKELVLQGEDLVKEFVQGAVKLQVLRGANIEVAAAPLPMVSSVRAE